MLGPVGPVSEEPSRARLAVSGGFDVELVLRSDATDSSPGSTVRADFARAVLHPEHNPQGRDPDGDPPPAVLLARNAEQPVWLGSTPPHPLRPPPAGAGGGKLRRLPAKPGLAFRCRPLGARRDPSALSLRTHRPRRDPDAGRTLRGRRPPDPAGAPVPDRPHLGLAGRGVPSRDDADPHPRGHPRRRGRRRHLALGNRALGGRRDRGGDRGAHRRGRGRRRPFHFLDISGAHVVPSASGDPALGHDPDEGLTIDSESFVLLLAEHLKVEHVLTKNCSIHLT